MAENYWASQSHVTNPGMATEAINTFPSDISTLRHLVSEMFLHYRGCRAQVRDGRLPEIHTRYAAAMFDLLLARGNPSLTRHREPVDRFVGCCRDATVLFLALARQKQIPARARVGFGSYFASGWWIDHVVAEVWDGKRWRLVDPQMPESEGTNWCDLTKKQFITGPEAWKAARDGNIDVNKCVVAPELQIKETRGWNYLAHHVIHDLASMGKTEMLLWDYWGMHLAHGPNPIPETDALILDEISEVLLDPDVKPEVVKRLMSRKGIDIPLVVTSIDPNGGPTMQVDVSRSIKGY